MNYFFDTYAIVEVINRNKNYQKFQEVEIATSVLNMGELYSIVLRNEGKASADIWYHRLKHTILSADIDIVIKAMLFKFAHKKKNLSFVDCVAYITAMEHGMIFLTGDKEFCDVPFVEFVK